MFCMNCGQQLPDGAKFCLECGTPQGAVSNKTTSPETIRISENKAFVPAMCPNCSAHMKVDSSIKIARCESCGTECLVQDAIKALTIKGNVQVGSATININGTNTESLLQRVEMLLADGDFKGATEKCDIILDSEPTNGKAYFYMLMISLECERKEDLAKLGYPYKKNPYYEKVIQYGDDELIDELKTLNKKNAKFAAMLKELQKDSELEFGSIKGKRIHWKVIDTMPGKVCITTTDIIRHKPYNEEYQFTTWDRCSLRHWLNSYFLKHYFSPVERNRITITKPNPDKNSMIYSSSYYGDQTDDYVFILSINEAKRYFLNNEMRAASDWWWLRVPGNNNFHACYVETDGKIKRDGAGVHSDGGVRPVMWIKID